MIRAPLPPPTSTTVRTPSHGYSRSSPRSATFAAIEAAKSAASRGVSVQELPERAAGICGNAGSPAATLCSRWMKERSPLADRAGEVERARSRAGWRSSSGRDRSVSRYTSGSGWRGPRSGGRDQVPHQPAQCGRVGAGGGSQLLQPGHALLDEVGQPAASRRPGPPPERSCRTAASAARSRRTAPVCPGPVRPAHGPVSARYRCGARPGYRLRWHGHA